MESAWVTAGKLVGRLLSIGKMTESATDYMEVVAWRMRIRSRVSLFVYISGDCETF